MVSNVDTIWFPCGHYMVSTWTPCGYHEVSMLTLCSLQVNTTWFSHGHHMVSRKPHGNQHKEQLCMNWLAFLLLFLCLVTFKNCYVSFWIWSYNFWRYSMVEWQWTTIHLWADELYNRRSQSLDRWSHVVLFIRLELYWTLQVHTINTHPK